MNKSDFTVSKITDNLYISSWPRKKDLDVLRGLNLNLVIHMLWQPPIKQIRDENFDFLRLITVDSPVTPLSLKILKKGVSNANKVIEEKGKVLVYCKSGIHRSAAMVACILVSQGMTTDEAIDLIKRKRKIAKPDTKYIKARILEFEKYWKNK